MAGRQTTEATTVGDYVAWDSNSAAGLFSLGLIEYLTRYWLTRRAHYTITSQLPLR